MASKILGGYTIWSRLNMLNSELFYSKPAQWFKVWFYVVNAVSHTTDEKEQRIRGQGYFTYEIIAKATGSSFSQIRHCIEFLKKGKHITTQKKPRSFNIIVNNYDFYQDWKNYIDEEKGKQKTQQKTQQETEQKTQQVAVPYKKALKELKTLENKEVFKKMKIPPQIEQVKKFIKDNGYDINPDVWWNSYQAKGWMIGKSKMIDWKAAVRTWIKDKPNKTTEPLTAAEIVKAGKTYYGGDPDEYRRKYLGKE